MSDRKERIVVMQIQQFNNSGTFNFTGQGQTPPPIEKSKDMEIKARIDEDTNERLMAFCRGRRISRSVYVRHLMSLDTAYFDLIHHLNDPEIKEYILRLIKLLSRKI